MTRLLHSAARFFLGRTPLGLWPVRVRRGVAVGARWTLYPWTSYWRGTHEPEMQKTISSLGSGNIQGWACWDLGAHFGLYSVGLARRVGPSGQVAAFEPNPVSFARLSRHARMNALSWLKPYAAAVSDRSGQAELYTYGDLGTTTSHLPYQGENRTTDVGALTVPTICLDELVRKGELRAPDFVKIDVEGHGHHALRGMQETLARARPIVIAGFHSLEEVDGMLSIFKSLGYQWREIGNDLQSEQVKSNSDYLFTPAETRA